MGEDDPKYTVSDWQYLVANGDTRLGYWDWVAAQHEMNDDDDDEICGQCNDPRCDGCVPFDTPSLDTSFHDHEMDV